MPTKAGLRAIGPRLDKYFFLYEVHYSNILTRGNEANDGQGRPTGTHRRPKSYTGNRRCCNASCWHKCFTQHLIFIYLIKYIIQLRILAHSFPPSRTHTSAQDDSEDNQKSGQVPVQSLIGSTDSMDLPFLVHLPLYPPSSSSSSPGT
jgi:hypothetical protein